jgi:hypothetical protein
MIVFGGRDKTGENRNDVWILTHANGEGGAAQWIRLIVDGAKSSPPARSGHAAVYDSADNRMIIFGGCSGYCAPVLNDVWVLTNANGIGGTPAWIQEAPEGPLPAARTNAAAAYDGIHLIIFGGQDGSADPCSTLSDSWWLTFANDVNGPSWSLLPLAPGSPLPAGQNGAACWQPTRINPIGKSSRLRAIPHLPPGPFPPWFSIQRAIDSLSSADATAQAIT